MKRGGGSLTTYKQSGFPWCTLGVHLHHRPPQVHSTFLFQSLSLSKKFVESGEMEESIEQPVFMDLQEQSIRDMWVPKVKWQTRGGGDPG